MAMGLRVSPGTCIARTFALRQAEASDCRSLWEWANDPQTRAASFQARMIPWEEHVLWFKGKLDDPQCLLLIACDEQARPLGQVRFDRQGDTATISVSLDAACRGRGLAAPLIQAASQECFRLTPAEAIRAFVKSDNPRSLRAFESAGYGDRAEAEVGGQAAVALVLRRGGSH